MTTAEVIRRYFEYRGWNWPPYRAWRYAMDGRIR